MAKKRYVKLEQGRYNINLHRDLAGKEANERGTACLYCGDYYPNAKKSGVLSFVCSPCVERAYR